MYRTEPDLSAIELQRLEQARRLHGGVVESCLIVEGVISIAEGENPRNIETKLRGFTG